VGFAGAISKYLRGKSPFAPLELLVNNQFISEVVAFLSQQASCLPGGYLANTDANYLKTK
jgi:hypothetical protein